MYSDDFSGTSLDLTRWIINQGNWGIGIGCQNNTDNVSVSGGLLHLSVRSNQTSCTKSQYTYPIIQSAGYLSPRPFAFTYGYAEARLKIAPGPGLWPAFWMYGVAGGSPELDIGEWLAQSTTTVYQTWHAADGSSSTLSVTGTDWASAFHTIGLDWQPGSLDWYVDGNLTRHVSGTMVPTNAMYVLLDHAVGGWAGSPDATTVFPADFQVDYVRVWSHKP